MSNELMVKYHFLLKMLIILNVEY